VTFVAALAIMIAQTLVEDKKTWIMWIIFGVFVASTVSGVFGVGALAAFGNIPMDIFPTVFFGWVFGDIIVLSTIGTTLMVTLTPVIKRTRAYIKGYFS
jgi:integral membrane sensor domain MASE1